MSLVPGTNADLMRQVAELYIEPDDVIVDATYGEGGFWRQLPELVVVKHDLHKGDGVDLRALPEAAGTVDVLALDPPYRLDESTESCWTDFSDRYGLEGGLANTVQGTRDLVELYAGGLREAARVLSKRGRVLVKCQDAVSGRRITPMLVEIIEQAEIAGLKIIVFVLHGRAGPGSGAWKHQLRARRSHSYLVVAGRSRYWKPRDPIKRERVLAGGLFDQHPESGDVGHG